MKYNYAVNCDLYKFKFLWITGLERKEIKIHLTVAYILPFVHIICIL